MLLARGPHLKQGRAEVPNTDDHRAWPCRGGALETVSWPLGTPGSLSKKMGRQRNLGELSERIKQTHIVL